MRRVEVVVSIDEDLPKERVEYNMKLDVCSKLACYLMDNFDALVSVTQDEQGEQIAIINIQEVVDE